MEGLGAFHMPYSTPIGYSCDCHLLHLTEVQTIHEDVDWTHRMTEILYSMP